MPKIMINYPPVYCDTHGAFIDECNDGPNCTWWTDEEAIRTETE